MRKILIGAVVLLTFTCPALAWNEKGHYVVCRLAWQQMTDQQRAKVTEILKKHPHYTEYLTKSKPEGFSTDEWAFMRAGAWADWVRSGSARSYGHSTWHYINYPVCFPGMGESEDKHQPPAGQENAVWAMNRCLDKIKNGTDEEKAIYVTWLCHLVGDIHQPLHCVALFSDKYPDGDRGGNAIRIRISSSPTNLHSFWDGLLGRGTTAGNIGKDVAEIQAVLKDKADAIKSDIDAHKTPEAWAKEGAELARHAVYLDGELLKAREDGQGVLQAPAGYAPACGRVARVQIGKAGIRLAEQLRSLSADSLMEDFSSAASFWQAGEVARKLVALGDKRIIPMMEKQLETKDRRGRCNAGLVLAGLGDKRGLTAIIREFEDQGPRPTSLVRSDGKPDIEGQIKADRYYAALLLGQLRMRESVPALIKATTDESVNYRVAISLGEIGDKSAIPALVKMAKDCPAQRLWAGYGLAALGEPEGFKLLTNVALSDSNWIDRRHAVEALGTIGDPRAVPTVVKALKDKHPNVKVSAAHALGKIGDPSALPALNEALRDSDATVVNSPTTVESGARKAIEAIKEKRK